MSEIKEQINIDDICDISWYHYEVGKKYYDNTNKNDYDKALYWLNKALTGGCDSAMYLIGEMYYYGKGVTKDYEKANYYYNLAGEKNNVQALYKLAYIFYNGLGCNKSLENAFKIFNLLVNKKILKTNDALDGIYEEGIIKNLNQANDWYNKNIGNIDNIILEEKIDEKELLVKKSQEKEQELFDEVYKSANRGNVRAQCYLSELCLTKRPIIKDESKYYDLLKWLDKAYEQGYLYALSLIHWTNSRLDLKTDKILNELKKLNNEGYVFASVQIEDYYNTNYNTEELIVLAEQNDKFALNSLGKKYCTDSKYKDKYNEGIELLIKAAKQNVSGAISSLIELYENNEIEIDEVTRQNKIEYYKKKEKEIDDIYEQQDIELKKKFTYDEDFIKYFNSLHDGANKNDSHALYLLGKYYLSNNNYDEDFIKYFEKAANLGHPLAIYELLQVVYDYSNYPNLANQILESGYAEAIGAFGYYYLTGHFVEQNEILGLKYLDIAIRKGYVIGFYNIGYAILNNKNILLDKTKAFEYFQLAYENDEVYGTYELAKCYIEGIGCEKDLDVAVNILEYLVKEKNYSKAYKLLENINNLQS